MATKKSFAEKKDEVYKKYKKATNMSYSELKKWSNRPCSKKASLSRKPIQRNLSLLKKPKKDWTKADVEKAKRTISFVARAKGMKAGKEVKGCGVSKNTISLKNWAYDPNKR